jgi:hypothetical protein
MSLASGTLIAGGAVGVSVGVGVAVGVGVGVSVGIGHVAPSLPMVRAIPQGLRVRVVRLGPRGRRGVLPGVPRRAGTLPGASLFDGALDCLQRTPHCVAGPAPCHHSALRSSVGYKPSQDASRMPLQRRRARGGGGGGGPALVRDIEDGVFAVGAAGACTAAASAERLPTAVRQ